MKAKGPLDREYSRKTQFKVPLGSSNKWGICQQCFCPPNSSREGIVCKNGVLTCSNNVMKAKGPLDRGDSRNTRFKEPLASSNKWGICQLCLCLPNSG